MKVEQLEPAVFFELLDEVLVSVGRAPLRPTGSQRAIVTVRPTDRVLQILAGAGSGKTEMLIWRVLYELFVLGTTPSRVMVTTFTRKAATELSVRIVERSDALLEQARHRGLDVADPHVHDLRIGTLHSLCDALLAEFDVKYMELGTELIDETETRVRLSRVHRFVLGYSGGREPLKAIDRLLAGEKLVALFRPPWDKGAWPHNTFQRMSFVQALLAQQTETWIPRCGAAGTPNGLESSHPGVTEDLIKLQERWGSYLDEQSILDFATVQYRFLQRQDLVVDHLDHVFVDEFQDTNPIQLAIHLGWLKGPQNRLTVVGDDDQALYRFRGSDIACFTGLKFNCDADGVAFRQEKLEENWRSSRRIVEFSAGFRKATVLAGLSMDKAITAPPSAELGEAPRLLQGPWSEVCEQVAAEIDALGAGHIPVPGQPPVPSVAILLFSTSEKSQGGAASQLRQALEGRGLRVYNPRSKTAAYKGSPVYSLLALLSYLIDPVVMAPAGKNGRSVMVWASCNDNARSQHAPVERPPFPVADAHASIQKAYRGSTSGIQNPEGGIAQLLAYLDELRDKLAAATMAHNVSPGKPTPRLTLSGVVARLLSFPQFRGVGFTPALFREALFTQLLEANIAPTRRSKSSLDQPLSPVRNESGKIVWPDEMWQFLGTFGSFLQETDLDDIEDDAFAEDAVGVLTFHQAKGLEFDHVYVGMTGREPNPHAVLQTMLFSGQEVGCSVDADGQPECHDLVVDELALADRERELYVAITRARKHLTIMHDPTDDRPMCSLNPAFDQLFGNQPSVKLAGSVTERRWQP